MRTVQRVGYHVSQLAFALALFGSGTAVAGAGDSAGGSPASSTGATTLTGMAQEVWARISADLAQCGLKIIGAVLILVVGRWVGRLLSSLAGKALTKARVDATLVPFIENLAYMAMLVFVVIAALAAVGVQTASLVAVLGAAGLAVGLALQGSLANFASGVLILVFKPFQVGDFVEISGVRGTVQAIHVFNTVLKDSKKTRIVVPNGQVTGGNILNYTVNGTRGIDLTVSVSYDDDLKKARRVIESVLAADKRILPNPAPLVAVSAMAGSSIDFVVRPWVKADDYWPVLFDLTEKLKVAIEENGMTIPFTQQDIHIKTDASAAAVLKSV
jgi:small conductance mechanosensitive channel